MLGYFGGYWDTWNSEHKVTFDGANKLIIINDGETSIDIGIDMYSAWKEWAQWIQNDNLKFDIPFKVVGGDPTIGDNVITSYYFLINGWRIRPFEGNHTLQIDGIVLVEGGGDPFVSTLDNWNVGIQAVIPLKAETIIIDNTQELDTDAPTWDTTIGVIDAYQDGQQITVRWGSATDVSQEVYYNVYISELENSLWQFKLGSFGSNITNVSTEFDGITLLQSGTQYFIGVRAMDKYGNEDINTNYTAVTFSGVTAGDSLTAEDITAISSAVWSESTRTLTGGGLSDEQNDELFAIRTDIVSELQQRLATTQAKLDAAVSKDLQTVANKNERVAINFPNYFDAQPKVSIMKEIDSAWVVQEQSMTEFIDSSIVANNTTVSFGSVKGNKSVTISDATGFVIGDVVQVKNYYYRIVGINGVTITLHTELYENVIIGDIFNRSGNTGVYYYNVNIADVGDYIVKSESTKFSITATNYLKVVSKSADDMYRDIVNLELAILGG